MTDLSIGGLLSPAWDKTFTKGGLSLMVAGVVACLGFMILMWLGGALMRVGIGVIIALAAVVAILPVSVGFQNNLMMMQRGEVAGYDKRAFLLGKEIYLNGSLVQLLYNVIVQVSSMLVIPAFILNPRLMFSVMCYLDDPSLSVTDAIGKSWRMTDGYTLQLLLLLIVLGCVIGVGCLLFGIGAIPAALLASLAQVDAFYRLKGSQVDILKH